MTDLATLAIEVQTQQIKEAKSELKELGGAAAVAETATESLTSASTTLDSALAAMLGGVNNNMSALLGLGTAQNDAMQEMLGLARASNDMQREQAEAAGAAKALAAAQAEQARAAADARRAAQEAAAAVAAEARAAQETADAIARLRGTVDPLQAAQDRLNDQLREAQRLYDMGAIGAAEYGRSVDVLESKINQAKAAQDRMNATHALGAKGAKLTAAETLNLSRQFADIGVTAAMGMNPLMILIQQGPQIADIFQTAGARGMGFNAVLGSMAAQLGGVLAIAGPIIAVVAAMGAAFLVATDRFQDGNKDLTKELGLTKDQIEDVKNKSITMGDTVKGFFSAVGKTIMEAFGPQIKSLVKTIDDAYNWIVNFTIGQVKMIAGTWAGAYGGIKAVWGMLPAAIGDAVITAANYTIRTVQDMVNKGIDGLNTLIGMVNNYRRATGQVTFDFVIPKANLGQIENQFAGAGAKAGEAFTKGAQEEAEKAVAAIDKFGKLWASESERIAKERILKEAGEANAVRKKKDTLSEAEKEYKKAVEAAEDFIKALKKETDEIGLNNIEKKMLAANTAMNLAPTKALKMEIIATAEAWRKKQLAQEAAERSNAGYENLTKLVIGLERENQLIGKNAVEQAKLTAAWALADMQLDMLNPEVQKLVEWYTKLVVKNAELKNNDPFDAKKLAAQLEILNSVNEMSERAAKNLEASFGRVGKAIGGLTTAYTAFGKNKLTIEANLARELEENSKRQAGEVDKEGRLRLQAARDIAQAEVASYGDMASAAKMFFKEKSDGYKALEAAEKAFRAIEAAMQLKALAEDAIATARSVANSGIRAAADGAAAFAKTLASLPFPFNLAAGAAVLGALAAVGVRIAGGGGGGGAAKLPTAEERQTAQGAGSILGDSKAKSESLLRAMEIVAANTNRDLEYSNKQLDALRNIEGSIDTVAALIARSISVGGSLDTESLGLGAKSSGNFLFSSSKKTELNDLGIKLDAQSVADILEAGLTGSTYQEVIETSKKKLFGITISSKSKNREVVGELDAELKNEIGNLIGSLRSGIISAAEILGVEGAAAAIDSFQVNLGKLSFKDMTGEEIQQELNAIFSKLGDDLAKTAIPELVSLQKVGEGAFETLARVAKQYTVVNVGLESIGMSFNGVGLSSLAARERLMDLVGGLDSFVEQVDFFRENFLTEAEQMQPVIAAVSAELGRLGLVGIDTKDKFKQLVLGLDVSTESGAQMYAALMNLAPAFLKVAEYTAELTGTAVDSEEALRKAAEIAKQRSEMTITLLEAQGKSEEALALTRQMALGELDVSLHGLQQQIWDTLDINERLARETETSNAVRSKQVELLRAQGKEEQATALERQLALEAMNPALREMQMEIWRLTDASTAAAEALAKQQALAKARTDLEIQILEAEGRSGEAEALRRQLILAGLDTSLHDLQNRLWAVTDANKAAAAAAAEAEQRQREALEMERARAQQLKDLLGSYKSNASEVEKTISDLSKLKESFADYRRELTAGPAAYLSPEEAYKNAKSEFNEVSRMAILGDRKSQDKLIGVSEALREASLAYNSNSADYYADMKKIQAAVEQTEGFIGEQIDTAQGQLDALNVIIKKLEEAGEKDKETIDALKAIALTLVAQGNQSSEITQALLAAFARLEESLDDQTREVARQ